MVESDGRSKFHTPTFESDIPRILIIKHTVSVLNETAALRTFQNPLTCSSHQSHNLADSVSSFPLPRGIDLRAQQVKYSPFISNVSGAVAAYNGVIIPILKGYPSIMRMIHLPMGLMCRCMSEMMLPGFKVVVQIGSID